MEVAHQSKNVPFVDVQNVLMLIALLSPFVGMWINYYAMWIIMFALGLAWILLTGREANAGLMFLWGLEFEPAPVDFVFMGSWFKRIIKGEFKWVSHPSLHLLLAFILLNVFQIFYSVSFSRGLLFAGITVYTISLAFYFSSYIKDEKIWSEIKKFYLIAVYISAVVLVLMILFLFIQGRLGRPAGFFKDPNVAGAFIATGALYAMSKILFSERKEIPKYVLIFLFLFISIILTFSRGSLLNLLSGIFSLGLISLITKRGKRFLAVLFITLLISIVSVPIILEVFKQSFRFRGAQWYDIYGRAIAWKAGIELFKAYPLGIGPGQFEHYSLDYQKSVGGPMLRLTPSAHNLYLRVLTENGIVGFALIIGSMITILFAMTGLRRMIYSTDILWLFSCLVGIIVQSFVIDTLHWRHFWILFGFLLALLNLNHNEKKF